MYENGDDNEDYDDDEDNDEDVDNDDDDDDDNPMILNYRAKNYTSERTIVPWTVIFMSAGPPETKFWTRQLRYLKSQGIILFG